MVFISTHASTNVRNVSVFTDFHNIKGGDCEHLLQTCQVMSSIVLVKGEVRLKGRDLFKTLNIRIGFLHLV